VNTNAVDATRAVAAPRLDSLPMELTKHLLAYAGAHSALTLECVSRLMQELRDENDNVWSETLGARWRTEGSVLLGLLLSPGNATAEQLFHAFATKTNLRTNILPPETPQVEHNPPNRLAFVLSLECGSFLLRWDGTQAVCEAVLETYVDVYSELATLHVIDKETLKCVTICENLRAGGELDGDEGEDAYFMVPDIMRHNLPQKFKKSSDLHDLEVVEGDATAEVCRMQLHLTLRGPHDNNTYRLEAQFLENNCSLDIPDWVTTVDQDDSDGGLAVRQLLVDAIEQS